MSKKLFHDREWNHSMRRYRRERDFLRDIVLEEVQEKIKDHERQFEKVALIGKSAPSWAKELPFNCHAIEIEDTLPIARETYDLVLHLHALHRVNDPIGQLIQARLALKPDGVLIVAFLGGESLQELRSAFHHAEATIYNGTSPHIAPMIEIKDAGNLLARAGLAIPVADNIRREVRYKSTKLLMHDLRDLALTNPLLDRRKNFTRSKLFEELSKIYTENFTCETGQIYASFEEVFLTGFAPSANQPKPLRPGSITRQFGTQLEN